MKIFQSRPGVTLVELMLFLALMAIGMSALIGFFVMTTDARIRQRARADIEQVAVQLTQMFNYESRTTERILLPARGATGSVLVLQSPSPDQSPFIFAVESGTLLLIRGANTYLLTQPEITVKNMLVENVSSSDDHPSAAISFTLERSLPLPVPELLTVPVELGLSPLPTDSPSGDECGCADPVCTNGLLSWETCPAGSCDPVNPGIIHCP